MSAEIKNFSFPLFSFVVKMENNDTEGYYLCLYQEKEAKNGQFCGHVSQSFESMIEHLAINHDCLLRKQIDYCIKCHTVFDSKYSAVIHGLTHIKRINYYWKSTMNWP